MERSYSHTIARINTGIIDTQVRPWLASHIYDSMCDLRSAHPHSLDLDTSEVRGLALTIATAILTGRDRAARDFMRFAVQGTYDPAVQIVHLDDQYLARSLARAYPKGNLTSVALDAVGPADHSLIDFTGHAMTRLEGQLRNER